MGNPIKLIPSQQLTKNNMKPDNQVKAWKIKMASTFLSILSKLLKVGENEEEIIKIIKIRILTFLR